MIQLLPMFVLAIGLFPFFLLQRIRSSERRWNPASDIQRYQNRLLLDVLPLLTVLAPVLLFLAFENRTFDNQSYVPAATTSSPVRLAMQFGAAAILTVVAFSLVLAKRVGATIGSLVAGVGISIAALFADASISKAHDFVRENGTPQPFTLRFELPDDVDGAEIEVNGVHLGTLPIELTVDELFHRVPPMSDVELKDFNSKDNPVTEWVFDENGMHGPGYKYWQSCHLQLPNGVSAKYPTSVKIRISANGEAGFGLNSFARRSLAHGNSYVFDLRFASWEEQINSLFDQARMSDYRVSIEWLDAWESWKWWSWNYLQSRIDNEPELTRIVDQLAEHRYHIKSIVTEEAAWSLLEKIGEEAVAAERYETFSVAGRAVELLRPMINKRRLFDHVASLIRDPLASGRLTHGWHEEMDRHFFYISSPHNDEQALSWLPFLHACWHQHRHEKSAMWGKETTVQTALAPKFLQLEAFSPGYTSFKWAETLGGNAFEEFAYRHDFEAEDDHRWFGSPAAEANRWFVTLMRLDSPRGQRFRAAYQEEILRIAELGLRELPGIANEVPDALHFLFLDKDRSNAAPLAVQFWPTVDAVADGMNHGGSEFALDLRLDYLSRIWPLSTTGMFVEAIMKVPVDEWIDPQKLNRLDDSVRFEILTAAIEALQEEQKKYRKPKYAGSDPYSRIEANITGLNTRRMHLPTESAAELFIEHWESKSDFYMPQLRKQMAVDSIHDDHVELLAKHEASRLRSIALSAIRSHPNVRRLIVLDMLRSDSDDAVRIEAARVDSDLKRLRKSAPPRYSTESLK